jgi:hypothetical protein
MTKENFTTTIEISGSSQEVFNSITKDVAKWWGGKDLEGSSTRLNDEFIIHHPGAHFSKQKVIEIIPDKKIVWLVTESKLSWLKNNQKEWTNTGMIFEINVVNDKTILCFTHKGLNPGLECYTLCKQGWTMVIEDYLFNYIVNGKAYFQF